LLGLLVLASVCGLITYGVVGLLLRLRTQRLWERRGRRRRRRARAHAAPTKDDAAERPDE
jgi:uncharacterized protein (DUF2062 family)